MLVYHRNFALKKAAVGSSNLYGWKIVSIFEKDFCVDDVL